MTTPNAEPLVLEVTPNDHVNFQYVVGQSLEEHPIVVEMKIKNPTSSCQLFKVKCTSNELFKIRPPVGLVKAGAEVVVKLTLMSLDKLPENDTHYFSIYAHPTEDDKTGPRAQWKDKKEQGRKRVHVKFEKQEQCEKKEPAPEAK